MTTSTASTATRTVFDVQPLSTEFRRPMRGSVVRFDTFAEAAEYAERVTNNVGIAYVIESVNI